MRVTHAGRLSMFGLAGWLGLGFEVVVGGLEVAAGGRRVMGKVVWSFLAKNWLEAQSMRPWTAAQKGQPRMVGTATSSPSAMARRTGLPSEKEYGRI